MLYMDTITSSKFRKTYATLLRPTLITANGHAIGEWHPLHPVARGVIGDDGWTPNERDARFRSPKGQQAERDRILARVNRGG